ncbi:diguanylate cyclase [Shewanella sp. VB17]|uniref:GGDEF domain-containing response regulator n=1 Tax=Shewanella sp. VB17 TaxID=2739432 RepID=UPI001564DB6E|nr:diguanylate cyclase [Shewanella sp. VB17]NRD72529.1 diguanylate cyclase [Shewanella sp. VB17]
MTQYIKTGLNIEDVNDPCFAIKDNIDKILIIDDAKDNRILLSELLIPDHKVFLAKDGVQGIKLACKHNPDLILLDVVMPGIDGYQVIKSLKNNESTMNIPVIFISSKISTEDERMGLDLGAVDYITKPFNPPIVQARVRNHLRSQRHKNLLEQLALIDALTEIYNRRFYELNVRKVWNESIRNNTQVSIAMIDIDFFKSYNDEYGHLKGDDALRLVANHIKKQLKRPHDIIARYGGEEFAVILPNTDANSAERLLIEICISIENLQILHNSSSISHYLTISIGGASIIPIPNMEHNSFLGIVDEHLYQAKAQGRNRVCWKKS